MPADGPAGEVTEDAALGGRLRLWQPRRGHRFGHDAVLLAASTGAEPADHVVEFGAGVGLAGLAVATRVAGIALTLVEIEAELVALAARNAAQNGFADVRAIALDVAAPPRAFVAAGLPPGTAQHVMMNPPFNDPARQRRSPDARRATAHGAERDTLAVWCRAAARILDDKGVLTLIWRADGLAETLNTLGRAFGAITILPVHPRCDAAAIRIIVRATKASRAPVALLPGLVLTGAAGHPTAEAEAILRDGATTALAR